MKTTKSVIKKVDRFNDPDLIRGIKIADGEEVQIALPNKKTLIIKKGSVTVM